MKQKIGKDGLHEGWDLMRISTTKSARSFTLVVATTLALTAAVTTSTSAQGLDSPPGEFSLGIGYAHLSIGGSDSVLDSEDALRFDSALMYSFFPDLPQLRVGFGFGVTLVLDDSERVIISDGGLTFIGSSDVPLYLLEPEFRVSWQQYLGAEQMFFIEPGIGVGGVFGNLNIDADDTASGESFDEWDSSFAARVFLNVGFLVEGGVAGIQASYMWAESLDFAENAGGEVEEFYVGIYGALQF